MLTMASGVIRMQEHTNWPFTFSISRGQKRPEKMSPALFFCETAKLSRPFSQLSLALPSSSQQASS
jgi:hypothetical protein